MGPSKFDIKFGSIKLLSCYYTQKFEGNFAGPFADFMSSSGSANRLKKDAWSHECLAIELLVVVDVHEKKTV